MQPDPVKEQVLDPAPGLIEVQSEIQEYTVVEKQRRKLLPRAALVGLGSGLVASLFRLALAGADQLRNALLNWAHQFPQFGWLFPVLLSALGAVISLALVRRYAPDAKGSGIPFLKAVQYRFREMSWKRILPVKFTTGVIALGSGMALGREGPTVQMGGAVGDAVADWLKGMPRERRTQRRIKLANFPVPAAIEDLDLSPGRGLDRHLILELAQSIWVASHLNTLVLGPTGGGKTFLACALGLAAARSNYSVRYCRTSRLLYQLAQSHHDGSYPALLAGLAKLDLLILDDWMRDPITAPSAQDLLEVLDDRFGRVSTIVASQVPVADWFARFPDPTLGDAILDRVVHNAYRLNLQGESRRKTHSASPMSST